MRLSREDFEALESALAKLILREHARHGAAQDLLRLRLEHGLERDLFQATGVHSVVAVQFLLGLAARHGNVRGIGHHDIVARVDGRVIDRLVLPHERHSNRARQTAQHTLTRIHLVPHTGKGQRGLD